MPHYTDYTCSACGQEKEQTELLTKRVTFVELGTRKAVRTRTIGFICKECVKSDPDYNREAYRSQGQISTVREAVRRATADSNGEPNGWTK